MKKLLFWILIGVGISGIVNNVKAITPVTSVEISHAVNNTWTDVDVTAQLGGDAGNVAGIILQVVNDDGITENNWGVQKNGSGDNRAAILEDVGHTWVAVGIDSNDIFELYLGDASEMDVYLVGYILDTEGSFFLNAVDKSLGAGDVDTWTDIDISGDTGGDTSKTAFFTVTKGGVTNIQDFGFRENGSTDDLHRDIYAGDMRGAMMSVDGGEIVEGYINADDTDFFLMGYLTDNITSFANAKEYFAAGAGSYEDADFSGDIPADNDGAFVYFYDSGGSELTANIIKKGAGTDIYFDISEQQHLWTEIDSNRVAEQKVESTNMDLYLWGYTNTTAVAPPVAEEIPTQPPIIFD